jgi:dTDP-4-dehydrorhamnose reductase
MPKPPETDIISAVYPRQSSGSDVDGMMQPGAAGIASLHGTFHFTGTGATTWYGFAEAIFSTAARYGHATPLLRSIGTCDYPTPAARPQNSVPRNSVLGCSRLCASYGIAAPLWRDSLTACIARLCETSLEVVA